MDDLPSWFEEQKNTIRNIAIAIIVVCFTLYVSLREWQFSIIHQLFLPLSCVWFVLLIVWIRNAKSHPQVN
jgi:multidrug efflux pump subunit AcrB